MHILLCLLLISSLISGDSPTYDIFYNNNNNNIFEIPRIIWLYWDGDMPGEVRYMLHNIKNNIDNYNIIFLSKSTINNYLDTNTYPSSLSEYPKANQADYYRFNLLYIYGGIWLDSSTFMKNSSFLDSFVEEIEEEGKEFGGFNSFYPIPFHIELGFMISYPRTQFVYNIIKEMNKCIEIGRINYMKKRIKEGIIIYSKYIYNTQNSSSPYYGDFFCFYVSIQTVVQRYYNNNPPILLLKSEDYFYKLRVDCNTKPKCMIKKFNNDIDHETYPIIIFTSRTRNRITFPEIDII